MSTNPPHRGGAGTGTAVAAEFTPPRQSNDATPATASPSPFKPEPGRRALVAHVLTYHLVIGAMLGVAVVALGLPVSPAGWAARIGFSALTHGFWDRRWPVVAWRVPTGGPNFAEGPQDRCLVDQGHHAFCLWVAALLITRIWP